MFLIICPPSDEAMLREILETLTIDPRFVLINENSLIAELTEQKKREWKFPDGAYSK